MDSTPSAWLGRDVAAAILGVSVRAVVKLGAERRIGTRNLTGRTEYWRADVERLVVTSIQPKNKEHAS